jgi:hypothetical protein
VLTHPVLAEVAAMVVAIARTIHQESVAMM